jgi:hypothetical protein
MTKLALPFFGALALAIAPAAADVVSIGETAQLTQGPLHYTGILVKTNTLAPCNAKTAADDIVFDPKTDKLVAWGKPCPKLPRYLPASAVQMYLKSGTIDLYTASTKNIDT